MQISEVDASGAPTTNVLEEQPLDEATLGISFTPQDIIFSTVSNRPPGTGLCFAITRQVNDTEICKIKYEDGSGTGTGYYGNI